MKCGMRLRTPALWMGLQNQQHLAGNFCSSGYHRVEWAVIGPMSACRPNSAMSQWHADVGLPLKQCIGGRNSSVGSAWARCPQCRGFDPPLGTFSVEWIFPLELTWFKLHSPKNSFGWEYKPRSSLCIHAFHRTDSKDPDVHVLDGWMPATKTHPARTIHEDGMWLP